MRVRACRDHNLVIIVPVDRKHIGSLLTIQDGLQNHFEYADKATLFKLTDNISRDRLAFVSISMLSIS